MACELCWNPDADAHNTGCPLSTGSLQEYNYGYRLGFEGQAILFNQYRLYSPSFLLGYRAGKKALEYLVDIAVTNRGLQ